MTYRDQAKRWSKTKRWRLRARDQLRRCPLCAMCEREGQVHAATVADHVVPHRGSEQAFWFGELQSLCWHHHSRSKQQAETSGYVRDIGDDGWPKDPCHPVYSTNSRRGGSDKNGRPDATVRRPDQKSAKELGG